LDAGPPVFDRVFRYLLPGIQRCKLIVQGSDLTDQLGLNGLESGMSGLIISKGRFFLTLQFAPKIDFPRRIDTQLVSLVSTVVTRSPGSIFRQYPVRELGPC